MSNFSVEVFSIKTIEPIPNADMLEAVLIGQYRSLVKKGQFHVGDKVAYIPEQSIVPVELLKEMGLEGRLAGPNKNRVKAIKLRGVVSQGLVLQAHDSWQEGMDVAEQLKITKYEPSIPAQFMGDQGLSPISVNYDIENFKKYPDVLKDGEEVVATEKIHGTFFTIGLATNVNSENTEGLYRQNFIVSSKGLIRQGIFIKDNEKNTNNTYIRAANEFDLAPKLLGILDFLVEKGLIDNTEQQIWLMGEVFGRSIQHNNGIEGYNTPQGKLGFRAFDVKVGNKYLDYEIFQEVCVAVGIETVPLVYQGPFSLEVLARITSGNENVSCKSLHIREGVVIKPVKERSEYRLGRVHLKSISDEYLLKSNGEEIS